MMDECRNLQEFLDRIDGQDRKECALDLLAQEPEPVGLLLLENWEIDSASWQRQVIATYGPGCSFATANPLDLQGKWLKNANGEVHYPVAYVRARPYSRLDYIAGLCSHEVYYAQFVSPALVMAVAGRFGLANLKVAYAADPHLNTIPLGRWDMANYLTQNLGVKAQLARCGDFWTQAGAVCILKEAARQAIAQEGEQ